jgi:hypothetical protein
LKHTSKPELTARLSDRRWKQGVRFTEGTIMKTTMKRYAKTLLAASVLATSSAAMAASAVPPDTDFGAPLPPIETYKQEHHNTVMESPDPAYPKGALDLWAPRAPEETYRQEHHNTVMQSPDPAYPEGELDLSAPIPTADTYKAEHNPARTGRAANDAQSQ